MKAQANHATTDRRRQRELAARFNALMAGPGGAEKAARLHRAALARRFNELLAVVEVQP